MSARRVIGRLLRRTPTLDPRQAYDLWAPSYRSRMNSFQELEEDVLVRLLPDLTGKAVLDVGCGTGRISILARGRGAAATVGVDFAGVMTDEARRRSDGAFICADACALPFAEPFFDVVVAALVLGHVKALPKAVSEIDRVLLAGGHVVISDFHPFATLQGSRRTFQDPASGRTYAVGHFVHLFEEYFRCFREHGWVLEAFEEPVYRGFPVAFVLRARKEAAT